MPGLGLRTARSCAADQLSEAEAERLRAEDGFPDCDYVPPDDGGFPFEHKASDWGRYDGKRVAFDYSIRCL